MLFIFVTLFIFFLLVVISFFILFWAIRFHFIAVLVTLDLMLLFHIVLFIFYTKLTENSLGYDIAVVLLVVAACDTSLGLALFVTYYRLTGKTNFV